VRSRAAAWLGLLLGAALLVATPVALTSTRYQPPTNAGRVPPHRPRTVHVGSRSPTTALIGAPRRLQIRALGVNAQVHPVDVGADGALGVPDDPQVVGWWRGGAMPGQPRGTVLLDGHVDSARAGTGALFQLAHLGPGRRVVVTTTAGTITYVVAARAVYAKRALPQQVFDQRGPGRLVLITCGGPFNRRTHHYDDNVPRSAIVPATSSGPRSRSSGGGPACRYGAPLR
jgi:hypothetical protein